MREPLENTEACLIGQAQKGDTRAFATLCERYRKRVWRVVASVARTADTDDLAQEALIRAFAALGSYRADAPFEAWLCRIALNAAHDYQRSAWRRRVLLWDFGGSQKELTPTPAAAGARGEKHPGPARLAGLAGAVSQTTCPQEQAERREVQRRVREAVARLSEKERVPIWLIYFEEFTLAEVARLEKVPESTVRSRVKAGLKRLERSLGDLNLSAEHADEPASHLRTTGPTGNASVVTAWKGFTV